MWSSAIFISFYPPHPIQSSLCFFALNLLFWVISLYEFCALVCLQIPPTDLETIPLILSMGGCSRLVQWIEGCSVPSLPRYKLLWKLREVCIMFWRQAVKGKNCFCSWFLRKCIGLPQALCMNSSSCLDRSRFLKRHILSRAFLDTLSSERSESKCHVLKEIWYLKDWNLTNIGTKKNSYSKSILLPSQFGVMVKCGRL